MNESNKLDVNCLNCSNKLFCTVNGTLCYSQSFELTVEASNRFNQKEYPKNTIDLINEYKKIESKRNCNVSYSPIKGFYE